MKKLKISFKETDKQNRKYKKYPRIDTDLIAFGSEEEVEQANIDYIKKIKTKVLKRFLFPTIVISLLLIVGISLYSIIQIENANQKYYVANERAESLAKQVRDYSEDSTLQKRAKERTENQNSDWKETAQRILDNREEKSTEQSSSNSYSNSTQRKCTVPDCPSNANTSSYYCVRHECIQFGCHEQKASDICLYCETHKCDMPGCNFGKANNSYYCHIHP